MRINIQYSCQTKSFEKVFKYVHRSIKKESASFDTLFYLKVAKRPNTSNISVTITYCLDAKLSSPYNGLGKRDKELMITKYTCNLRYMFMWVKCVHGIQTHAPTYYFCAERRAKLLLTTILLNYNKTIWRWKNWYLGKIA